MGGHDGLLAEVLGRRQLEVVILYTEDFVLLIVKFLIELFYVLD